MTMNNRLKKLSKKVLKIQDKINNHNCLHDKILNSLGLHKNIDTTVVDG